MRYLKENYPTSWLYKGTYSLQPMDDFHPKKVQSIKIYNLYPMIQYEFKVKYDYQFYMLRMNNHYIFT